MDPSQKEELEKMDKLFSEGVSSELTNSPSTESASTESPSTEAASTESPATEVPTTDAPVDELESLRNKVNEFEALLKKKQEVPEDKKVDIKVEDEINFDEINLVDGLDIEEVMQDPTELNKLLKSVLIKGMELARKEIGKTKNELLETMPDVVKQRIEVVQTLKKASDDFYETNKDLKPFKKIVTVVFDELMQENPNRTYNEILRDVEKEVRTRLELPRKSVKEEQKPPTLPSRKGQPRQQKQSINDPLADEMSAMEKAINY